MHAQDRALACPIPGSCTLLVLSEKGAKGLKACQAAAAVLEESCGIRLEPVQVHRFVRVFVFHEANRGPFGHLGVQTNDAGGN